MIRINLLPVRAAKKAEAKRQKTALIALGYIGLIVGLGVIYVVIQSGVEKVEAKNRQVKAEIEVIKKEVGDLDKIKAQIKEMQEQEKVVTQLIAGRTGPVLMLRELSWILTPGRGPSYDRKAYEQAVALDPNAGFNQGWDPKRVWISKIDDKTRNLLIEGGAKSNEDVAEFMKRLQVSAYFARVDLTKTMAQQDRTSGVKYVTFFVSCTANLP
jgi:type IV pilus assembly protein PilN